MTNPYFWTLFHTGTRQKDRDIMAPKALILSHPNPKMYVIVNNKDMIVNNKDMKSKIIGTQGDQTGELQIPLDILICL